MADDTSKDEHASSEAASAESGASSAEGGVASGDGGRGEEEAASAAPGTNEAASAVAGAADSPATGADAGADAGGAGGESEPVASQDEPEPRSDGEPPASASMAARKGNGSPPVKDEVAQGGGHGHDEHGLSHVMSVKMLVGVWAGLMFLTIVTVAVTKVDLGASGNLMVAMVIATIKAVMVMAFFMHLLYDKRFNVLVFLSSVLFVVLFLTLTIQDRSEYQHEIDEYRLQQRTQ